MVGRLIEFLVLRVLSRFFPSRYRLIPRVPDGTPLLRQFRLTDWAYLQSFANPEVLDKFHVHRWRWMLSFVLSGQFIEERYPGDMWKVHSAPSVYTMDHTVIHRLAAVDDRTWTLFLMFGRRLGGWGYYPRLAVTGFTPWDKAIPTELRLPASWDQMGEDA